MIAWKWHYILLILCCWFFGPEHCAHAAPSVSKFDRFKQDERVLAIISREAPADVKTYLGWTTPDSILHALHKPRWRQWTELFCGTGTMSKCLMRSMPRGESIDIEVGGDHHDMLTSAGFANCLVTILSLVTFAFCWMAPPCSLWVFLSAGVHKRSALNPSGDTSRQDVRSSNTIVHRCCILARIMVCRLVQFVFEQPVTSLMFKYSSFMRLRRSTPRIFGMGLQRRFLWLGHWGGALRKPTALWGVSAVLDRLSSKRPRSQSSASVRKTTLKSIVKDGRVQTVHRIYGVRKVVRNSQVYPEQFCSEVAGHVDDIYRKSLFSLW